MILGSWEGRGKRRPFRWFASRRRPLALHETPLSLRRVAARWKNGRVRSQAPTTRTRKRIADGKSMQN